MALLCMSARSEDAAPRLRKRRGKRVSHARDASKHLPSRVAPRHASAVPLASQRTYFVQPAGGRFGKAMEALGWTLASKPEVAEVLWYQRKQNIPWDALERWQRPNHVRRERELGHKALLANRLAGTPAAAWLPETYDLGANGGRSAFAARAAAEAPPAPGDLPRWLLKNPALDGGTGIAVVADGRDALDAAGAVKKEHAGKLAQRYVADLLLFGGRKFDLRIYWVVASFRPVLVLVGDGTLRVSLTRLDETPENGTGYVAGQHLTNAAQQAGGHAGHDESSRRPMSELYEMLERERRPDWPADPAAHVECEIRRALQEVWRAYGGGSLLEPKETRDAFVLLGADLMIDGNLDVYLSEIQSGPGLPVNTAAVRTVVTRLVPDIADIMLAVRAETADDRDHAAARALAEGRGFEAIFAGTEAPEPRACAKLRS